MLIDKLLGALFQFRDLRLVLCACLYKTTTFGVFIARQHAVLTERDIVLSILSVCLSVRCR